MPLQPVELQGFTPLQIAQLTQQGQNPNLINNGAGDLYYRAAVGADFSFIPPLYLFVLGCFILASLVLVALFLRRKDVTR